jgi:hypothetical protein
VWRATEDLIQMLNRQNRAVPCEKK